MMDNFPKTQKILRYAAEIIIENGLCKGVFHNPKNGSYCAMGAIIKASEYNTAEEDRATSILQRTIAAAGHGRGGRIIPWNDSPERTKEEVADMLMQAATASLTSD